MGFRRDCGMRRAHGFSMDFAIYIRLFYTFLKLKHQKRYMDQLGSVANMNVGLRRSVFAVAAQNAQSGGSIGGGERGGLDLRHLEEGSGRRQVASVSIREAVAAVSHDALAELSADFSKQLNDFRKKKQELVDLFLTDVVTPFLTVSFDYVPADATFRSRLWFMDQTMLGTIFVYFNTSGKKYSSGHRVQ